MRYLILFVCTIAMIGGCKKNKDTTTPPATLNQWDGRYRIEGAMVDNKNPAFVWAGDTYEYSLHTSSTTTDSLVSKDLGSPGHLIKNGINLSYYGTFGLVITFDPATNKVIALTNYYGQPSASGRSAVLDPSGINSIDPATKNIRIKYWMDEAGFAGHRVAFNETWVYLGPR